MKKVSSYLIYTVSLLVLVLLTHCQTSDTDPEPAESMTVEEPPRITLTVEDLVDSSGAFTASQSSEGLPMLGSTADGQWLEFELPVAIAGRYRSEVLAVADTDASVWIEDYVGNPDGRTYNVTGDIMVRSQDDDDIRTPGFYREGSPFNVGTHAIRLHFKGAGVHLQELRFTLMRRNKKTPQVLTQNTDGAEWKVVWSDEFDGTGMPDTSKWTYDIGDWGWGNNELQYYTAFNEKNARLEDGNLIIEAHKNDDGNAWTSARLTTRGKVTFRYGKIELRAKVPKHRGNWAAGWMLGDAYVDELSWPYCGEIDILESVGYEVDDETGDGKTHASVHCRAHYHKENTHRTSTLDVERIHQDFHVYTVEWTPERIKAFLDGQEYFMYDETTDERSWPFNEPQNIILNLAMGGGWGGARGMDESVTSQQYILDYVRVYELN